jgi:hypothetical protein
MADERLTLRFHGNDWDKFDMQISWVDADGFSMLADTTSESLTEDQLKVVAAIAGPLVALKADWMAKQVIVTKFRDSLNLIVIAEKEKNGQVATKVFTENDLEELRITDEASIALFDGIVASVRTEETTEETADTEEVSE